MNKLNKLDKSLLTIWIIIFFALWMAAWGYWVHLALILAFCWMVVGLLIVLWKVDI